MASFTAHKVRQFEDQYRTSLSSIVFRGLCSYLYVLLQWGYTLQPPAFDSFILAYPRFLECCQTLHDNSSYHVWLLDHGLTTGIRGHILSLEALSSIRAENPYTFEYAAASLIAILRQREKPGVLDTSEFLRGQRLAAIAKPIEGMDLSLHSRHDQSSGGSQDSGTTASTDSEDRAKEPSPEQLQSPQPDCSNRFEDLEGSELPVHQWHSEKDLRSSLRIRDKHELLTWLKQDWVLSIYDEYCTAELDPRRAHERRLQTQGVPIPRTPKRSSAKFLINSSVAALRAVAKSRFLCDRPVTTNWTSDDHDIRFMVRLVQAGRVSGRWWENRRQEKHLKELCIVAYRLLSWLRYTHRLSSARSKSSQMQRAAASHWYQKLTTARTARAKAAVSVKSRSS